MGGGGDTEPQDRLPALREECKPSCTGLIKEYQECAGRIKARGVGDCEPQYFDYLHCVDKCVAPKVMQHTV